MIYEAAKTPSVTVSIDAIRTGPRFGALGQEMFFLTFTFTWGGEDKAIAFSNMTVNLQQKWDSFKTAVNGHVKACSCPG